jgi:hypothetical protein
LKVKGMKMRIADLLIKPTLGYLLNAKALGIVTVIWICGLGTVVANESRLEMAESKHGVPSKITVLGFQQSFLTSATLDESLSDPQNEAAQVKSYFLRIGPNLHPVTGCGNVDTLWDLLGRWPAPVYQQDWDSLLIHENLQSRPKLSCDLNQALEISEGQVYRDDTTHRLLIPTGAKDKKEFYSIPVDCGYTLADRLFRVERRSVSNKVPDVTQLGKVIELHCGASGRSSAEYRLYFDVRPDQNGNERNVLTLSYEAKGKVEAQLSFCRLGSTPLSVVDKDKLKTRLDALRKYLDIDTDLSPLPSSLFRPDLGCFDLCADDECTELADDSASLTKPEMARALSPAGVGLWGARVSGEQRTIWFEQCASADGLLHRFLGVDTTGGDDEWITLSVGRDEQHPRRFLSLQNEGLPSAPAGFFRCPQKVERKRLTGDEYSFVELQGLFEAEKSEASILELVVDHKIKIIAKDTKGKNLLVINDRVPYDEIRIVGESVGNIVEPSIIFDLNCNQNDTERCQNWKQYTAIDICCGKRLEFHHLTVSAENFFQVNSEQKSFGIVSDRAVTALNHATLKFNDFRTGLHMVNNSLAFCDHCILHAKVRLLDASNSGIFAVGTTDNRVDFKAFEQPNDDDFSVHLHDSNAIFSAVNINNVGPRLFGVSGLTRALVQSGNFILGDEATEAFKIGKMGHFILEQGRKSNTFKNVPRGEKFSLLSGVGTLTIDTGSKFLHPGDTLSNVWDVLACQNKKNGKLFFRGKNRCDE